MNAVRSFVDGSTDSMIINTATIQISSFLSRTTLAASWKLLLPTLKRSWLVMSIANRKNVLAAGNLPFQPNGEKICMLGTQHRTKRSASNFENECIEIIRIPSLTSLLTVSFVRFWLGNSPYFFKQRKKIGFRLPLDPKINEHPKIYWQMLHVYWS